MYLTGLNDDYEHDGRVITQILADPNHALRGPGVAALGACYKQLNSSVGQFGTYTLQARDQRGRERHAGRRRIHPGQRQRCPAWRRCVTRWRCASRASSKRPRSATSRSTAPSGQTFACQAVIASADALANHV